MADLACPHQAAERIEGLGERHHVRLGRAPEARSAVAAEHPVGPVELVEVHVVGAHAREAGVERGRDVPAVEPGMATPHGGIIPAGADDLGGDDDLLAPVGAGEPAPQDFLAQPPGLAPDGRGIHLGVVDEVDAGLERRLDLGVSLGLRVLPAPGHGSEAERADLDIGVAELAVFHVSPLTSAA